MCKPSKKPAHGCPMACNALMTYCAAVLESTLMHLHSRFHAHAGPHPAGALDAPAILARVTQTANLMRRLGVQRGDVVAYILPNLPEHTGSSGEVRRLEFRWHSTLYSKVLHCAT